MATALADAMTKIVTILSPLDVTERQRVVHAALALLGDPPFASTTERSNASSPLASGGEDDPFPGAPPAATAWLKRSALTLQQLEQFFHADGGKVTLISAPQTATKRIDQVVNVYLLQGFATFLGTGDSSFPDSDARERCEYFGCYDSTNHSKYLKEFGNKITGSKSTGWKLTAPGMSAAAELIRT